MPEDNLSDWPKPCLRCQAEAKLQRFCEACGGPVYVIDHKGTHYFKRGSTEETLGCRCSHPRKNVINITTQEQARLAAQYLHRGMPVRDALRQAGYPETTYRKGNKAITSFIRAELLTIGKKYIKIGKEITPEDQEAMVRGKLVENILRDSDKAVLSAKQLGSDKRISMWQPDSQVGMVVLSPPPIPKVDHEVPWMESRFQKESAMQLKSQQEEGPEHEETPAEGEAEEVPSPEVWEEEEKKYHKE